MYNILTYDLWPGVTLGSMSDSVRLQKLNHDFTRVVEGEEIINYHSFLSKKNKTKKQKKQTRNKNKTKQQQHTSWLPCKLKKKQFKPFKGTLDILKVTFLYLSSFRLWILGMANLRTFNAYLYILYLPQHSNLLQGHSSLTPISLYTQKMNFDMLNTKTLTQN